VLYRPLRISFIELYFRQVNCKKHSHVAMWFHTLLRVKGSSKKNCNTNESLRTYWSYTYLKIHILRILCKYFMHFLWCWKQPFH